MGKNSPHFLPKLSLGSSHLHYSLPMAPSTPRHRPANHQPTTAKPRDPTRTAKAKRGLRSLTIAIVTPVSLTLAASLSSSASPPSSATFRHAPLWTFHVASACASALASLSAWLVWAEGGFRREPAVLPLYLWQLAALVTWAPLVLGMGYVKAGLVTCLAALVALVWCSAVYRRVNPAAARLVRPSVFLVMFLAFSTFRLL